MSQQTADMSSDKEEEQRGRRLHRTPPTHSSGEKPTSRDSQTLRGRGRRRLTSSGYSLSPPGSRSQSPAAKSLSENPSPSKNPAPSKGDGKHELGNGNDKVIHPGERTSSPIGHQPTTNVRSQSPSRSRSAGAPRGSSPTPRRRQRTRSRSRVHEGGKEKKKGY